MEQYYCPTCKGETGHKRNLGWGTFFGSIFTLGISLFFIPFYPKRCVVCGNDSREMPFSSNNNVDKRICPFCAEEIKKDAIKCKHCGSMLSTVSPPPTAQEIVNIQYITNASIKKIESSQATDEIKQEGLVVVSRLSAWVESLFPIKVKIDGILIAELPNGKQISKSITTGRHKLTLEHIAINQILSFKESRTEGAGWCFFDVEHGKTTLIEFTISMSGLDIVNVKLQ